ncbi:MAG: hypothetical protein KDK62_01895 [Chlamydiia bacterium]|nr:hypothetical protein [Chlamydiia bacterium]
MSVPSLKTGYELARTHGLGLPDYFKEKLEETANYELDESLIQAEASRYQEAAKLADSVGMNLIELLKLSSLSPDEQVKKVPFLETSSNVLTLRTPMFLSAIGYICHKEEEVNPYKSQNISESTVTLPVYFKKIYETSTEQERLRPLFEAATRSSEHAGFKLAAVVDHYKTDLISEEALYAIRYTTYVSENMEGRAFRILTGRGSRLQVLSS